MTSDGSGLFRLAGLAAGRVPFILSAPGFVTYASQFQIDTSIEGIELRLIRNAPPFALEFYRQFARNGHESELLQPLRPWTMSPRFYLRTTIEENNQPVPEYILLGVERIIGASVQVLSAGRWAAPLIDRGTSVRSPAPGWVVITFHESLPNGYGGQATVGGNEGIIRLRFDGDRDAMPLRGCDAATLAYMDHEIVHTMGFWHTGGQWGSEPADFLSEECSGHTRGSRALHHAAVVYSRPPGNQDPDRDPASFILRMEAGSTGSGPLLSCLRDTAAR